MPRPRAIVQKTRAYFRWNKLLFRRDLLTRSMILNWWKDLAVAKKLYAVVGVMALLIATELFTLLFAMDVLSSVRTFVGGEGLWSKAQKNTIHNFQRYALTREHQYWDLYQRDLKVPEGDHAARMALEATPFAAQAAFEGFKQGSIAAEDIPGLINLIRRFYWVSYIDQALKVWREADMLLINMRESVERARILIESPASDPAAVELAMREIETYNDRLTAKEIEFSNVLGTGSRWLESVLMALLICAVLTVESTGLFLTVAFSRSLNRTLKEIMNSAEEVGRGNFSVRVPVRSRDDLGQVAAAINKMNDELATSIGARRQAESASESKTMFLANMSHEIRTPLGVMLGLAEMLKEPGLTRQDQLKYAETIERTGGNLARIINDILDISRVESGHLEIEMSRFDLRDFLADLQAMLTVAAMQTGNTLTVAGPSAPVYVQTDRIRLRQILINLVNNAFKFTAAGTVRLSARVEGGVLIFEVSDTGAGISDDDKHKLFKAFSRAENPAGAPKEGSGLGLVLSKRLAQALGGDVTLLRSVTGQGTVFQASVLANETAKPGNDLSDTSDPPPGKLQGRKILVVEDSEDNQMLVRLFLARHGALAEFAGNGEEGVERAMHGEYDAVLMDMQMPVMDGYRATAQLRENGFRRPIIALTAHAMKEDRERCIKAGCDEYLTKPIDASRLYSVLVQQVNA